MFTALTTLLATFGGEAIIGLAAGVGLECAVPFLNKAHAVRKGLRVVKNVHRRVRGESMTLEEQAAAAKELERRV